MSVPLEFSATRSPSVMLCPSLVQLTSGFGTPLTAHVIEIVASLNALIFEPTPAITLVWSSDEIDPFDGRISGSNGSEELKSLYYFDSFVKRQTYFLVQQSPTNSPFIPRYNRKGR